jgi:hypothetical protein
VRGTDWFSNEKRDIQMEETTTRVYPANRQVNFDRERAEFERDGWEVASIDYQESRPGCFLPLVGVMMYRPANTMIVTYRKRAG